MCPAVLGPRSSTPKLIASRSGYALNSAGWLIASPTLTISSNLGLNVMSLSEISVIQWPPLPCIQPVSFHTCSGDCLAAIRSLASASFSMLTPLAFSPTNIPRDPDGALAAEPAPMPAPATLSAKLAPSTGEVGMPCAAMPGVTAAPRAEANHSGAVQLLRSSVPSERLSGVGIMEGRL